MNNSTNIRILHELIAALDRRQPQAHREHEAEIAEDAASLRARALDGIAELEDEPPSGARR